MDFGVYGAIMQLVFKFIKQAPKKVKGFMLTECRDLVSIKDTEVPSLRRSRVQLKGAIGKA